MRKTASLTITVVCSILFTTASRAQWMQTSSERTSIPGHTETDTGYPFAISGKIIYEVIDSSLFRMVNGGDLRATGLKQSSVLSVAASDSVVFAGTNGNGIFCSSDSGMHWISIDSGLNGAIVYQLSVSDGFLYAATWDAGVWRRPLAELTSLKNEPLQLHSQEKGPFLNNNH